MNQINRTGTFAQWLHDLNDGLGKAAILRRIEKAQEGHFGEIRPLGDGVTEMKIHVGPGYRLYYAQQGSITYLLLIGGTKRGQQRDIEHAKAIWKILKGQNK